MRNFLRTLALGTLLVVAPSVSAATFSVSASAPNIPGSSLAGTFEFDQDSSTIGSFAFTFSGFGGGPADIGGTSATFSPTLLSFNGSSAGLNARINLVTPINALSAGSSFDIQPGSQFLYRSITPNGFSGFTAISITGTITPSEIATVPEPATWAMMIGGFGMIGGAMRRKRKVTTTVAFA